MKRRCLDFHGSILDDSPERRLITWLFSEYHTTPAIQRIIAARKGCIGIPSRNVLAWARAGRSRPCDHCQVAFLPSHSAGRYCSERCGREGSLACFRSVRREPGKVATNGELVPYELVDIVGERVSVQTREPIHAYLAEANAIRRQKGLQPLRLADP